VGFSQGGLDQFLGIPFAQPREYDWVAPKTTARLAVYLQTPKIFAVQVRADISDR
jgi:hypothetical protein